MTISSGSCSSRSSVVEMAALGMSSPGGLPNRRHDNLNAYPVYSDGDKPKL